jgi:uncharacterized protein YciI
MSDTREQCWVIATTVVSDPPLQDEHHAYIQDLDERGLLVAHGGQRDETGVRTGTGFIVIRAATRAEAETIAQREPYIASGARILNLIPWQVTFARARA